MRDKSKLKNCLIEIEQQLLDPQIRTSLTKLDKLLTDDFSNSVFQGAFGAREILLVVKDLL